MIYSPQFEDWFCRSGLTDKGLWARLWNDALMARPGVAEFMDTVVMESRNAALEEAAKVADEWQNETGTDIAAAARICPEIAAAIRALKG